MSDDKYKMHPLMLKEMGINDEGFLEIDLWYRSVKGFDIGLMDVRATDGIRVEFDFPRNGWSIQQPTRSSWEFGDEDIGDQHWKEVFFAGAFALQRETE